MGELLAKIPLSSGRNNLKESTPLVKRECICKPIFPPVEMPLSISQNHFSTRRNAFVNFATPFFHPPKCLCHFRKTIFPPVEMPLSISQNHFPPAEMPLSFSQNHFSTRRNAFVNFAKPFFHPSKCLCQFRKTMFDLYNHDRKTTQFRRDESKKH